jgi:hypothetical protein
MFAFCLPKRADGTRTGHSRPVRQPTLGLAGRLGSAHNLQRAVLGARCPGNEHFECCPCERPRRVHLNADGWWGDGLAFSAAVTPGRGGALPAAAPNANRSARFVLDGWIERQTFEIQREGGALPAPRHRS